MCEALRYAHDSGVVHRDIKPENVLIAPSGRAKLADFGLAKLRDPSDGDYLLTATQQLMGTLHYMAPEQTESPHLADHRADVYALGVLLYEMLTGELPLGVFDPPSSKCRVDRRVDEIVLRALAKDPERRFATAAEFLDALAIISDLDEPALRDAEPRPESSGQRRIPRRVLIAAGFAAALLIAFLGWQFLLKYHKDKDGSVDMEISASGDKPAAEKKVLPTRSSRTEGEGSLNPFGVKGGAPMPLQGNKLSPAAGSDSNGPPPSGNNSLWLRGVEWQAGPWQNQFPLSSNGTWANQPASSNDSYSLSNGLPASSNKLAEKPAAIANDYQARPAEKPAPGAASSSNKPAEKPGSGLIDYWSLEKPAAEASAPSNKPVVRPRRGTDDIPTQRPAEKPSTGTGNSKTRPQPNVSLIEIAGPVDHDTEGMTEDLPILLSHPVQKGSYPEKSLTLDYQLQVDRLAKEAHYYLVIDGDHIGHNEMPIPADSFAKQGQVRVARMPKAGNGEPLRIFIEVAKPGLEHRVRASNIVKTTVKIAGTPSGEIRYPNHLAIPAAAIHWNDNRLDVSIKGEWYELLEINGMSMKRIMDVAQQAEPKQPHEYFENHLPELLKLAGQTPGDTVSLEVRNLDTREELEIDGLKFTTGGDDKSLRR